MPNNKNQHYVPQFYLRNFAPRAGDNCINVYNIERERLIENAPIKGQCAKDYWHTSGSGPVEDAIRQLEASCSRIITSIIDNDALGDEAAVTTLQLYLMFQHGRTLSAVQKQAEMIKKLILSVMGSRDNTEAPSFEVEVPSLSVAALHMCLAPIIADLSICLAVNHTALEFVASDDPVAVCNWWLQHRPGKAEIGTGLGHRGLEIYFPLSPRHQLILYDRAIWAPKRMTSGGRVKASKNDVLAMNERQALNARSNLYLKSSSMAEVIEKTLSECKGRRAEAGTKLSEYEDAGDGKTFTPPPDGVPAVGKDKLVELQRVGLFPQRRVELLFRSEVGRKKIRDDGTMAGPIRDPAWMVIVDDFVTALQERRATLTRIMDFAQRHPLFDKVGSWKERYRVPRAQN